MLTLHWQNLHLKRLVLGAPKFVHFEQKGQFVLYLLIFPYLFIE